MCGDIEPIALTPAVFSQVRFHRNNRRYRFLLDVCRMVAEDLLPSENEGQWHFVDFTRDEMKMNQLFEKFVFNIYRLETSYKVRVEEIKWTLDSASPEDLAFLPIMRTDITLQNSDEKIIMDAKYYRETMSERYSQKKIKSGNMYQLFSYLINQETEDPRTLATRGILLYPAVDQDYDLRYRFEGHRLEIRTVNLHADWDKIDQRLKEIVGIK